MRRIVYSTLLFLLLSLSAVAQNGGINFQGMARNAAGEALANQKISLRLSVLLNSESGTVEYSETKEVTTSGQGIFSIVVGDGNILTKTGNFSDINWKTSPKFLKVEMDPSGGTNFALLGTSRLQAVPFAYYANGVDAENIQGTLPVAKGGTGVGSITALKTSLGIDQVNNTADANKPISTATQTALNTKVDKVTGKELSSNDYTTAEKTKLAAITGTNTGDQDLSGLATTAALAGKVDKVNGKELSSNDFTTAEKTKLAAITGTNTGDQDLSGLATTAALATKANTSDVTSSLALKANTADVTTALAGKANASDVTSGLAGKENAANKSNATDLGGVSPSDVLFPTQKAVKAYVAANAAAGGIADGGITTIKLADGAVTDAKIAAVAATKITGTLPVANGGTGASTAAAARTNLALGNVDNTSDANKPISTLTQTALDLKAPLVSPTFTGTPVAPTATAGTNTSQIATTQFVTGAITTANARLVPYSGATQAVNLGNFDLTVNGVTVGIGKAQEGKDSNTAIGRSVLSNNTTGSFNAAVGYESLLNNTSGSGNTANGFFSLSTNTTGSGNTANGQRSLFQNTTGDGNTATGFFSLFTNTTGNGNTANGYESLYSNETGIGNTASGQFSLNGNTTGDYNTAIGFNANVATGALTNATAIGSNASVTTSNTIQLGDPAVTAVNTSGTVTAAGFSGLATNLTGLPLTTGVTGTLPVANGGTGAATLTGLVKGNGTNAMTTAVAGTDYLTPTGSAAGLTNFPTFNQNTTGNAATATIAGTVTTNANLTGPVTSVGNATSIAAGAITDENITAVAATKITGTLPVANGGTGASTAAAARTNLALGNVDNTSDANKPISTLTQTALDLKAPLASPTFTGTPVAPTATAGTNTPQIATTQFVTGAITTANAGVVPYSGATQAVNLGDFDLTVNGVIVGRGAGITRNNTAIGEFALRSNTEGAENTAIGSRSLSSNTTGFFNTSMGFWSLSNNTTGWNNSAFGQSSLFSNTTGTHNTAVGAGALQFNTTGTHNTAIGWNAGTSGVVTNSTAIGSNASVSTSNTIQLGDPWVTSVNTFGSITAARFIGLATNLTGLPLTTGVTGILRVANGGTGATTLTGLVKGNGTNAMTAAVAGTDYLTPTGSAAGLTNFPTFNQNTTGNAATATIAGTVTTNANLTGPVTSVGNATSIAAGAITDENITAVAATKITGTLPVANGGTGAQTLTENSVLLGNGTSPIQAVAPGTSGNVLTSNGTTWTSAAVTNFLTPTGSAAGLTNFPVFLPTVVIGTQQWMEKNLDVMTYRDGTVIPQVTDPAAWAALTTGAWRYYNNDPLNGAIYGKLYNWYAVNDSRGLCPRGWHIPTNQEWTTLTTLLGVNVGGKMKTPGTTLWASPNIGATNESGFSGLPGGYVMSNGQFANVNSSGFWWSATEESQSIASYWDLANGNGSLPQSGFDKKIGASVRCLRD